MELVKVSSKDIYQDISGDVAAIYNHLIQNISDVPFAEMKPGIGFYIWKTEGDDWNCITHADELEVDLIYAALNSEKSRIGNLPGYNGVVDKLFTYPDDNYVFYRYAPNGSIEIKIAGWGYKKSYKPVSGGPIVSTYPLQTPNPITIAFYKDSECLPNREFSVVLPHTTNTYKTDDEGKYVFSHIPVGKKYDIIDLGTHRHFSLEIEDKKHIYNFVVEETKYSQAKLKVVDENDTVVPAYPIEVVYANENKHVLTDTQGVYQLPTLKANSAVTIIDENNRDNRLDAILTDAPAEYVLHVRLAKEPEMAKGHIKAVGYEVNIGRNYPLILVINGETQKVTTNDNSIYSLPELPIDTEFDVKDGKNDDNIQHFVIERGKDEYLFVIPAAEKVQSDDIKCTLLDVHSHPIQCESVKFIQGDKELSDTLNPEGTITFARNKFTANEDIQVIITNAAKNYAPIVFQIEEGENEYILQERILAGKKGMKAISILTTVLWFLLLLIASRWLVGFAYGLGMVL